MAIGGRKRDDGAATWFQQFKVSWDRFCRFLRIEMRNETNTEYDIGGVHDTRANIQDIHSRCLDSSCLGAAL